MVDMVSDALNVSWDITPKDYYHAAIMAANSAYPMYGSGFSERKSKSRKRYQEFFIRDVCSRARLLPRDFHDKQRNPDTPTFNHEVMSIWKKERGEKFPW